MGKAIAEREGTTVTVHAPIRVHLTFRLLRALRIPESVALDLVWGWFRK